MQTPVFSTVRNVEVTFFLNLIFQNHIKIIFSIKPFLIPSAHAKFSKFLQYKQIQLPTYLGHK